jgi:hypothetical protein
MRIPYTYEELAAMKRNLDESIEQAEREYPNARPLPPMTRLEAEDLIMRWIDTAVTRQLTADEAGLMGQLLACYRMGIQAEMLGKKGRYFVLSEAEIERLAKKPSPSSAPN